MVAETRWLLPDGIDELLPEQAGAVEHLRRALLDECARWGYRYVIPPLVEFTDSLLVGLGADLDTLTCTFADRNSGRTLGVRADITPQVARIDAHSLAESGVTRLCYAGSTLHSASQTIGAGRSPIQLGAELYGFPGIAADIEVIDLMLVLLARAHSDTEQARVTLDIGHVGVYSALLENADLDPAVSHAVFDALQRKSKPDLELVLEAMDKSAADNLRALVDLHGGSEVLSAARAALGGVPDALAAIDEVEKVMSSVQHSHPGVSVYIDFAELRGFSYHTGVVFAAYLEGVGSAVAKGGRYDNIGAVFGRNRPATGFAFDLRALAVAAPGVAVKEEVIAAPPLDDTALVATIRALRAAGKTVITRLDAENDPRCNQVLVSENGTWVCQPATPSENA
jgi:ATP phosphoribosyltransferase regulatory subunit